MEHAFRFNKVYAGTFMHPLYGNAQQGYFWKFNEERTFCKVSTNPFSVMLDQGCEISTDKILSMEI